MKLPSGLEISENNEGSSPIAESGHTIIYNVRNFRNHGDEVPINETQAELGVSDEQIRRENDQIFIDHISTLGKRQAIGGIEKALLGMRVGGFRKVRVVPHLAYRDRGLSGLIPPDAVPNTQCGSAKSWSLTMRSSGPDKRGGFSCRFR